MVSLFSGGRDSHRTRRRCLIELGERPTLVTVTSPWAGTMSTTRRRRRQVLDGDHPAAHRRARRGSLRFCASSWNNAFAYRYDVGINELTDILAVPRRRDRGGGGARRPARDDGLRDRGPDEQPSSAASDRVRRVTLATPRSRTARSRPLIAGSGDRDRLADECACASSRSSDCSLNATPTSRDLEYSCWIDRARRDRVQPLPRVSRDRAQPRGGRGLAVSAVRALAPAAERSRGWDRPRRAADLACGLAAGRASPLSVLRPRGELPRRRGGRAARDAGAAQPDGARRPSGVAGLIDGTRSVEDRDRALLALAMLQERGARFRRLEPEPGYPARIPRAARPGPPRARAGDPRRALRTGTGGVLCGRAREHPAAQRLDHGPVARPAASAPWFDVGAAVRRRRRHRRTLSPPYVAALKPGARAVTRPGSGRPHAPRRRDAARRQRARATSRSAVRRNWISSAGKWVREPFEARVRRRVLLPLRGRVLERHGGAPPCDSPRPSVGPGRRGDRPARSR